MHWLRTFDKTYPTFGVPEWTVCYMVGVLFYIRTQTWLNLSFSFFYLSISTLNSFHLNCISQKLSGHELIWQMPYLERYHDQRPHNILSAVCTLGSAFVSPFTRERVKDAWDARVPTYADLQHNFTSFRLIPYTSSMQLFEAISYLTCLHTYIGDYSR